MYAEGDGTPQDNVRAYLWFSLAADQGEQNARQAAAFVSNRLTPAQRAEAERLGREWRPKTETTESGGKEP